MRNAAGLLLSFALCVSSFSASAGIFSKASNENVYVNALAARGAAVYVAGSTTGLLNDVQHGVDDAFLVKLNVNGGVLWKRQFGTQYSDTATGVAADAADNSYVVGTMGTTLFLRKYDPRGTLVWSKAFGNASVLTANGIALDRSGNIFVVGRSASGTPVFVRKFDKSGKLVWTRLSGDGAAAAALRVATDKHGNAFVVGYTFVSSAGRNVPFVIKYDTNGKTVWKTNIVATNFDAARGVAVDSAGSVIVVGTLFTSKGLDQFVKKFSNTGAVLFSDHFGTASVVRSGGVTVDGNDNIYITGYTDGAFKGFKNAGLDDVFVRKYNSHNKLLWTKQFGSAGTDQAGAITAVGAFLYVGGSSTGELGGSSPGGQGVFVRRITVDGAAVWTRQ
jgi:hypothetical protein